MRTLQAPREAVEQGVGRRLPELRFNADRMPFHGKKKKEKGKMK